MQSATDTKQPVVTHGFLGTVESSSPPPPTPVVPISPSSNYSGKEVNGQICSPVPGSGLLRSVSQRLLSTIGAGAGAGGAGGERERDEGGGGSQSPRPPRGGAAWILQTRVRARGRAPRGEEHKRNGGLAVVEEVQTAENNKVCNRLPPPSECGHRPRREHRPAAPLLVSSAGGDSERKQHN